MRDTTTHTVRAWLQIRAWLHTPDAATFCDDAVSGCLLAWEAEDLLDEHGLRYTTANRAKLMTLIEEVQE